jgi:hypothetical protein
VVASSVPGRRSTPANAEHLVTGVVATHDVDPAGTNAEVVSDHLADRDVGLTVDWGGRDPHDKTAIAASPHLVAPGTRDHPHVHTLVR